MSFNLAELFRRMVDVVSDREILVMPARLFHLCRSRCAVRRTGWRITSPTPGSANRNGARAEVRPAATRCDRTQ